MRQRSSTSREAIGRYAPIIESFLAGRLTADEFEDRYLGAFREDPGDWPDEIYDLLNEAFLDVEAFWLESDETDEFLIDEPELRRRMAITLAAMRAA